MPPARTQLVLALLAFAMPSASRADDGTDFFEKKIRPAFVEHCHACHAGKKEKGGLRLDTPDAIRKGGESGPLVKAKDEKSLLLLAVAHGPDAPAMPPTKKLPDAIVADLRKWVMMGAPMPVTTVAPQPNPRDHWAFKPAVEQPAPKVSDAKWPRTKADAFILAKLDEHKLTPAPPADKRPLARRACFDLVGLPPTFEQVEAFVTDTRTDAFEKLVDELLASPRFGEKWGRHWLDVARYAEDHSTSEATCKPPRFPFRYRDWVIAAFNADVPFDRFVKLQLAADRQPNAKPDDLAALGFLGLSPVYHKEPRLSKDVIAGILADEWDERIDAITRGFLGLTVACARCHDHKFDPISTKDYYALAGVLANTQLTERALKPDAGVDPNALTLVKADLLDATLHAGALRELRSAHAGNPAALADLDTRVKQLEARAAELRAREKKLDTGPLVNAVRDAGAWVNGTDPEWTRIEYKATGLRDLSVLARGDVTRPGVIVPRRFLTVLSASEPKPFTDGSGRRELADAIVTDAASLTARVFVNRVWGWVFGHPLVSSPSNFGTLGDKPTHTELLDDLAARFIAKGWSVKWLVRELVLSTAYRQASKTRDGEASVRADPENKWLGRATVRRLEVEQWRDAALQASGQLDLKGGGPSDNLDSPKSVRRTVFGKVSRNQAADVHRLFDLPDPKAHGEKREVTTTPVQQLYFLNSPFVRQAAVNLAKAVAGKSIEDGTTELFRKVYLRDPTTTERATAEALTRPAKAGDKPSWELLAQVLLASNEFLFLD